MPIISRPGKKSSNVVPITPAPATSAPATPNKLPIMSKGLRPALATIRPTKYAEMAAPMRMSVCGTPASESIPLSRAMSTAFTEVMLRNPAEAELWVSMRAMVARVVAFSFVMERIKNVDCQIPN